MKLLLPFLLMATPALAADPMAASGTRLTVSASAAVARAPDLAVIGAGVVTQAGTAAAAVRDNADRMTAALAALRRAGIAERDLRTSSLGLAPQYRYGDNQPPVLTGYQATNRLQVRLHDLTRVGAVVDALAAAGANQIDGPDFQVAEADAALDEARVAAVAKARARAELYARAAGLHVARIVSLSEADATPPIIRPLAMMAMRKGAATPVEPGEQQLTATVQAEFELQ